MANVLRIKRRLAGGSAGAPASLATGELAWNQQDNILYGGFGDTGSGVATSIKILGGEGAFAVLNSPTFTGTPAGPTASVGTNTTQFATTAFVLAQGNATAGTIAMNGTQAAGSSNLYARADHVHPTDTSRAPLASPTFTGKVTTAASATGGAGFNAPHGAAPTSPANGDLWTTTAGLFAYINGTTIQAAPLASPSFSGTPSLPTGTTGVTQTADTNNTTLATTAFVLAQASGTTPAALGTAAVGTATRFARADHVHAMPTLSQVGAPTADVPWGSFKITGLADPTNAQDAATKNYVDLAAQGLDAKQSVRAGTTANITTLAGGAPNTVDGVTLSANDRVLVKNQTTTSQNGIYTVTTLGTGANGTWARAADMNVWSEVPNAFVFVEEGTTLADTSWVVSSNAGGTIDSSAIVWFQFGSAASYTAGNGLQLSGNSFSVLADGSTITVSGTGIKVSNTYPGNSSLVTLGTVTTGTWNATTIAPTRGGTGLTAYTTGDLLYASGTNTLAALAGVATGNVLISGGVTTAPSWGKVGLTTHVSGTLAVGNGGTGVTTLTGLVKGSGTSAFTAAVAGTDYHDTNSTIDGGTF
jgi:hypothetical protein